MALDKATLSRLGLDDFVVIDLETSGLNPITDEIIEFGAVRFIGGAPEEGVSQLLRPKRPLPAFISKLTGITPEDVALAPEATETLPQLLEKWTTRTLAAHNLPFELKFLNACSEQFGRERISDERGLDTLVLARTFLPTLYNHKLETVASQLKVPARQSHRARDDAEMAGHILLALAERGLQRDVGVLELLSSLAPPGAMRTFIQGLEETVASVAKDAPGLYERIPESNWVPLPLDLDGLPANPLDVNQVVAALGNNGQMASSLTQFEQREEQQDMAKAVGNAFNDASFLVAEAGTGVGKSFAYLVPAAMWSARNDGPAGRVVLSTRTKTLQDQLFHQDIPKLKQAIYPGWNAVLLKGRQNYLCLRRMDSLLKGGLSAADRASMMPLVTWLDQTQTGDLEEAQGIWQRNVRLWVYDDPEYCVGRRCQFYDRCFSVNARTAAKRADLVVVNHALLLADLTLEGSILGDYKHLVVDEAHHLEKSARQALQHSVGYWPFKNLFDELLRRDELGRETGLLLALKRLIPAENTGLLESVNTTSEVVFRLRQQLYAEFERLTAQTQASESQARDKPSEYTVKKRYDVHFFEDFVKEHTEISAQIDQFAQALSQLTEKMEAALDKKSEELCDALQATARNLDILRQRWNWLLRAEDEAYVCWYELPNKENALIVLNAVPLDVGESLLALYERLNAAIFTSATLSLADDFSYFQSRVGLDRVAGQVRAENFGQPFDHEQAVHLSVPTYMPDPNDPKFAPALAELLFDVCTFTQKHTMALFTSYKLLKQIEQLLQDKELFVCAQGADQARSKLLDEFRHGPPAALLLGTDSFWEGIDLPGDTLEIVVLTKLPFPVPSDPLVSAEEERLKALGKSAFSDYSLPQAILALRQGFGRLLRSKTDRGAVILTDARIVRKSYGKRVLKALPCEAKTYFTLSSLLLDLKQFFASRPDSDEES